MIRAALRAVAVPAIVGTALLATVVPANASSLQIADETGDNWTFSFDEGAVARSGAVGFMGGTLDDEYVAAGSARNTDLTSTTVNHTQRRVFVKGTYVDLVPNGRGFLVFQTLMKDNDGHRWVAYVTRGRGRTQFALGTFRSDASVRCAGLSGGFDLAANTARLSIPRSCMDTPRTVKVRALSLSVNRKGFFFDDATSAGHSARHWSQVVRAG
jgi:hypothetical protein